MKYEKEFNILKSSFPDSEVKFIESNVNNLVSIKYGQLSKVAKFLMDCGVNFQHYDGTITLSEYQLRMI